MSQQIYGQCARMDGVYTRELHLINFPRAIYQDSSRYLLVFDTITWINSDFELTNKNYDLIPIIINKDKNDFILINRETGKKYYLGQFRDYHRTIQNEHYLYTRTTQGAVFFNFTTGKYITNTDPGWFAGYDDTSVYFYMPYKKPRGWGLLPQPVYRYSTSGLILVKDQPYVKTKPDRNAFLQKFYNPEFSVYSKFLYSEEINCSNYHHTLWTVYSNEILIDSFEVVTDGSMQASFNYTNDTLTVYINQYRWQYFSDSRISFVNIGKEFTTVDSANFKFPVFRYFEDYVIVSYRLSAYRVTNPYFDLQTQKTINGLSIEPDESLYTIYLLFDKNSYKFIGYPAVKVFGGPD